MQTIAIINRKGGVGKSTVSFSLAGAWSARGRKVLCIDLDPQASLTDSFRLPAFTGTAADLFSDVMPPIPVPTVFPGLFILPGSSDLDQHNVPDPRDFGQRLYAVRDFVAGLDGFDVVLIDAPPNLYLLSYAALVGASHVITPTRSDRYGADALEVVNAAVASVQAGSNQDLVQLGFLLSAQKKNTLHAGYAATLRAQWPGLVLDAVIPEAAAFGQAADRQTPITILRPRGSAAKAVVAVADEIERRVAGSVMDREAA